MSGKDKKHHNNEQQHDAVSKEIHDHNKELHEHMNAQEPVGDSSTNQASGKEEPQAAQDQLQQKEDALQKLQEELNKKNEELSALKDLLMRRQADFENYKKRVIRMQEDDRKLAIKDMALDVITINDDLIRAIEAASNVQNVENLAEAHTSFVEGVKIISRQIEDMLKRYGVEEIESYNQPFDPEYNEAIEIDESPDVGKDTITKVYQKGFKLDKYVIRAARVKVTRPAKKPDTTSEQTEENTTASPH
ncbi:MAG: nucleotide exchange factor GrpE [Spirochaetota bacterium]|nr:nucleotide exchange factor GrpE [Spirochaetota bacterium]